MRELDISYINRSPLFTEIYEQIRVRTVFFDSIWEDVPEGGLIASLGCGMDARPLRLAESLLSSKKRVAELDKHRVLEEKKLRFDAFLAASPTSTPDKTIQTTLTTTTTNTIPIPCNLPTLPDALHHELLQAPSCLWSAEGLMEYLPLKAQKTLLKNMKEMSEASHCESTVASVYVLDTMSQAFEEEIAGANFGAWATPLPSIQQVQDCFSRRSGWDIVNIKPITEHSCSVVAKLRGNR